MRMLKFLIWLVLLLLIVPNVAHARLDEGETDSKIQKDVQVKKVIAFESVIFEPASCKIKVLTLDPDFPVYFVKDECLSWGLSLVPNPAGTLYCKLGFWEELFPTGLSSIIEGVPPSRIYGIFSAVFGKKDNLDGWQYCSGI